MLLTLLGLVAVFFTARYLVQRYRGTRSLANWIAGTLVVSFLAGFGVHQLLFGNEPVAPPVAAAPTPTDTPSSGPATPAPTSEPPHKPLTKDQIKRLVPVAAGRGKSQGNLDSLTLSGVEPPNDAFRAGSKVTVSGWAADPTSDKEQRGALLIVDGNRIYDVTAAYGAARPDVAGAYKLAMMMHSGINAVFDTSDLPKGKHTLALATVSPDGTHYDVIKSTQRPFTLQ